jgi:AAA15 family ATPase/GTPase
MGDQHLTYFKVENFKRFDSFEMDNLGQFNLLVGDNNVGKTSVLEALLSDEDFYSFNTALTYVLATIKKFSSLRDFVYPIDLYVNKRKNNKYYLRFVHGYQNAKSLDIELTPSLINQHTYEYLVNGTSKDNIEYYFDRINKESPYRGIRLEIPFIPFGSSYDHDFTTYYSHYIQFNSERKKAVIAGLKGIAPMIENIEVNISISEQPVLLISEAGRNEVLPLVNYGDGFLKLFRLLMAIVANTGKRLMIDEIDTGIHYSRAKEFWKVLIEAAKENDVQLFATSHSKECMQYFTEALAETNMQAEGRIIRLAEVKDSIKAYTMHYEEFEHSLQYENEIR